MSRGIMVAILMLAILNCSGSPRRGMEPSRSGSQEASILWAGMERTFRFYKPASQDAREPAPLLFVLHGGGGTGKGMEKLTLGRFNALSDQEGFIVVYPDGIERHWNDGRGLEDYRAHRENVDDVGFLSAVIDRVREQFNVDPERVYATGISNGGMMSFRLACELAHRIAAIAVVTASMSDRLSARCNPSRPVPVLIMNGKADPLVPWGGGEIRFMGRTFGRVIPTPDIVEFWKNRNGCSSRLDLVEQWDRDPQDGTRVRFELYGDCARGAEVVLYSIEGGGHTWPRGYPYLPEWIIGRTSSELDACSTIWDFFKRHSLKRK